MASVLRIGKRQWLLAFVSGLAFAGLVVAGCSDDPTPAPLGGTGGDPGAALAAKLEADTGKPWIVDVDPQLGTPDMLEPKDDPAPVLTPGTTPEAAALAFLERYQASFGTSQIRAELHAVETDVDEDGLTHVRFEQVSGSLPVFGEGLTVHFTKSGAIAFVNGRFAPNLAQLSKVPARTADVARKDALANLPGGSTKDVMLGIDAAFGKAPRLVYRVRVEGSTGKKPVVADVLVDAQAGTIVVEDSRIHTERASGRGVRGYAPLNEGDTKSFEVERAPAAVAVDGGAFDAGVFDAGGDAGVGGDVTPTASRSARGDRNAPPTRCHHCTSRRRHEPHSSPSVRVSGSRSRATASSTLPSTDRRTASGSSGPSFRSSPRRSARSCPPSSA